MRIDRRILHRELLMLQLLPFAQLSLVCGGLFQGALQVLVAGCSC